jgi:hypothetical protein
VQDESGLPAAGRRFKGKVNGKAKSGGPPSTRKRRTQKPRKAGPTKATTNSKAKRRMAAHLPPENGGRKNRERWALQRQWQIQRQTRPTTIRVGRYEGKVNGKEERRPTFRQKTADAKTAKGGPYKGYGKFKGKAKNGGPPSARKRRTQKPRKAGPIRHGGLKMRSHLQRRQIQRQRRPTTRRVGPACDRQALQKQLLLWGGLWRRLGLGRRRRGLRLR